MNFLKYLLTNPGGRTRLQTRSRAALAVVSVAMVITTMLTSAEARAAAHAPRASHTVAPAAQPAAKASGKQLTDAMRKAAASIGKATKSADPKQVSPKIKKQQPFFAAMRKTNADIKLLSKAITARDSKDMQRCMGRTGKGISELNSTYKLSGINNAQVADGIKKLNGAYTAFRKTYGPGAARAKKGTPLTAAEKQNATALKTKYQQTLTQLKTTRDKASKSSYGKTASNIAAVTDLIDSLTTLLAVTDISVDYYVDLLAYEYRLAGEWYGIS